MEKLNNYQICALNGKGKDRTATAIATMQAENLADAYAAILETHDKGNVVVYPLATLADGETVYTLADYARRQFNKWELRNNNAVMSALNRSTWDKEDERQDAAAAIVATLTDDENATMYTAFLAAYNKLAAGRDNLFRKSEAEYNPGAMFCNPFTERKARATFPRLAALIARATEAAGLTDKQAEVLEMYESGTTCAAALELLEISKRSYYQNLYTAMYKTLKTAAEMDGEHAPTFTAAGIDRSDISDALAAYAKRARVKTN